MLVDGIEEAVCFRGAVICNVIPDIKQISPRTGLSENSGPLTSLAPLTLLEPLSLSRFSFDVFYVEGCRLSAVQSFPNVIAEPLKLDLLQAIMVVKQPQSFTDHFTR
jgi:hypothetical protein